jgi:hypothetical protein
MASLLLAVELELGVDPRHDPRPATRQRARLYLSFAAVTLAVPAVVLGGRFPLRSASDAFVLSLVPLALVLVVSLAMWRKLASSPYTLRGGAGLLVMLVFMAMHRGCAAALGGSVAEVMCVDLLGFAAFLAGAWLFGADRWFAASAGVLVVGAAVIAVWPAYAAELFGVFTVALLPPGYLYWVKGSATKAMAPAAARRPERDGARPRAP